jgi:nitrate/nitrite transporter NarK
MSTTSFLHGVKSIAQSTLMQYEFTDHQRATMASLNSLGGNVGYFVMSLVLGGLADALGPAKALIILTVISLPVIYIYWVLFRRDNEVVFGKI